MKIVGVIPARLAATRLPNKPLLLIAGRPMVQHVWESAMRTQRLNDVIVATPDREILEAVEDFGGRAMLTSDAHRSGTDRVAEIARNIQADIFVNIQGDEPLIEPETIDCAVEPLMTDETVRMTSLMCRCPADELDNPACVKVVCNKRGDALYFSRSRIPFARQAESTHESEAVMQHIGLYAYRQDFLLMFAGMAPTPLESTEALEQLRILENGYSIRMVEIERAPLSVDTPDDLARAQRLCEFSP